MSQFAQLILGVSDLRDGESAQPGLDAPCSDPIEEMRRQRRVARELGTKYAREGRMRDAVEMNHVAQAYEHCLQLLGWEP